MSLRHLAWCLFGISATTDAAGEVLLALLPSGSIASDTDPSSVLSVAFTLMVLVFALVGAVVSSRMPANPIGWLLCGAGVTLGLQSVTYGYAAYALIVEPGLPGGVAAAWLSSWIYVPALLGVPPLLFLLFPDGRPLSPRWRLVVALTAAGLVCQVAGSAFAPGGLRDSPVPQIENPVGLGDGGLISAIGLVGWTMGLVSVVLAAWSLVLRYRGSRGVVRQQLKWVAWSALLLPAFLLTGAALASLNAEDTGRAYANFALPLILGAVPASAGLAILRYRLYDIDLVIKRTLVYGSLTALLVVAYLGLVLVLRLALSPLTGQSDLSVAGSTLAVAALFRPLRSRIQSVVDRRFYRQRYDAARTLETFGVRLRDELDLETLGADLHAVVHDTMQPTHVSLWLRDAGP